MSIFFFFQAEDGIRDDLVTGVQTCALPICNSKVVRVRAKYSSSCWRARASTAAAGPSVPASTQAAWCVGAGPRRDVGKRSEERPVGKECTSGWGPEHEERKREDGQVEDGTR